MALFKFTKGILEGAPTDIYNHGEMYRDFTYVDDLVRGLRLLMDVVPVRPHRAMKSKKATVFRRLPRIVS
jgi:UDP-glucuronate 4-epimerase